MKKIINLVLIIVMIFPIFFQIGNGLDITTESTLNQSIESISTQDWVPTGSNGKSILFDEHHGGEVYAQYAPGHVSMLGGFLLQAGYAVNTNIDKSITAQTLEGVNVLVVSFPQYDYSTEEVTAIHNFIQQGNSAIFVGTAKNNREGIDTTKLNPITEDMGVTFAADFVDVRSSIKFTDVVHSVSDNVSNIYVSEAASMTLDSAKALDIIATTQDGLNPIIVTGTYGLGKVMFISTRSIFQNFIDRDSPGEFKFIKNSFDWLSGVTTSIDTTKSPAGMPIPIRQNETIPEGILKRYQLEFGNIHIHSHEGSSDSATSVTDRIDRILELGYDFATLTDHDSDTPMNSRQPALDYLQSKGVTPDKLNFILGIEADSQGGHFVTFPIQNQDHYDSIYSTVENYHKQNAMVFWSHPLLTYSNDVKFVFENFDDIGLNGFEIVNSGFFGDEEGGIGEFALTHSFIGASDAHSSGALQRTENYVFATDQSTGSIQDAIANRRNVVYARYNGGGTVDFYTGDSAWLNEFYRRNDTANLALSDYQTLLSNLASSSFNLDQAKVYLNQSLLNHNLRNIHRVVDNVRLGMLDLYPTDISLATSDITTGSDVTFDITMKDQQQNTVSDSNIHFKLFDGLGNLVSETTVTVSSTNFQQKFTIPTSSVAGQYFLWSNVTIKGAFFENRLLFNVTEPTVNTNTTSTSSTSSTKTSGNFEIFILLSSFLCLAVIKKRYNN